MANSLYGPWRFRQLGGTNVNLAFTDLDVDDIQAILQDADYVRNLETHDSRTDMGTTGDMTGGGTADMGTCTLSAPAVTTGIVTFDASVDTTFTSVTGAAATQIVIFNNTGAGNDNRALIANFDTATGLPVTPNGGNIVVQWHANGIFTW